MTFSLTAIGVSPGMAVGRAYILTETPVHISRRIIRAGEVQQEVQRFKLAVNQASQKLREIRDRIPASVPAEIASFIEANLLMMEDGALIDIPIRHIRQERCSAEWAIKRHRDALVEVFDQMNDPYLRTRKDDIDHVVSCIVRELQIKRGSNHKHQRLGGRIVVARDLSPAEVLNLKQQGMASFATERGGANSHAAILARSLSIPAVVGARGICRRLTQDERVVVDGTHGVISAAFEEPLLNQVRLHKRREKHRRTTLTRLRRQPAVTVDGYEITLMANIGSPADIPWINRSGAQGVGLFRTELLFLNPAKLPSEEQQYRIYRALVQRLNGKPLTIRTADLDAGVLGEQASTALEFNPNPVLGLRGIRYALSQREILSTQLRAIYRAARYGPVRILIPMVTTFEEVLLLKQIINEIISDCGSGDLRGDPRVPLGAMLEVPGAALLADAFAAEFDFLSIGTNDLIQYTLAADRLNDEVEYLYDPFHPSIMYLIEYIISAGRSLDKPVEICGELAGNPRAIRLLLALGLRIFSMHPSCVPEAKRIIHTTSVESLKPLVKRLQDTVLSAERSAVLDEINRSS